MKCLIITQARIGKMFVYICLFSKFVKPNLGLGSVTKPVKFKYNNVFIKIKKKKKLGYEARFKYIYIYIIFLYVYMYKNILI